MAIFCFKICFIIIWPTLSIDSIEKRNVDETSDKNENTFILIFSFISETKTKILTCRMK